MGRFLAGAQGCLEGLGGGRDAGLVTLKAAGGPCPPAVAPEQNWDPGHTGGPEYREQLRPLNSGGGEAPLAAPILGPGTPWPPTPRPPQFRPANTSAHLESLSPRPPLGPAHLEIPAPLRGNGGQPAPREEGAGGGGQSLHYVSGLQMWQQPARPQLVWMGPRALGSPGMRFPHRLSPQPLAGRPPSRSLPPFSPSHSQGGL